MGGFQRGDADRTRTLEQGGVGADVEFDLAAARRAVGAGVLADVWLALEVAGGGRGRARSGFGHGADDFLLAWRRTDVAAPCVPQAMGDSRSPLRVA